MKDRKLIIGAVLFILLLASVPRVTSSSQLSFPPYDRTKAYVANFLSVYNNISRYNFEPGSSPAGAQRFFVLDEYPGQTFKVIVMLAGPHDNSSVNMVFVPIPGTEPRVIYDNSDYLFDMRSPAISAPTEPATYPGNCAGPNLCATITITPQVFTRVNLTTDYSTADDLLLNFSGKPTFATVAIGVNATDITGDYNATSEAYANWLYQSDAKSAQDWVSANEQTTTTASESPPPEVYFGQVNGPGDWLYVEVVCLIVALISIFSLFLGYLSERRPSKRVARVSEIVLDLILFVILADLLSHPPYHYPYISLQTATMLFVAGVMALLYFGGRHLLGRLQRDEKAIRTQAKLRNPKG